MALQPALGLGTSLFPFKKEIAMATVVRFDNLVTNFFHLKEIFKSCLVSGIILQVSVVLGVVSLFVSGQSTDTWSKRGEGKWPVLIFVSGLLGGCYVQGVKKGALEQRFQLYCGRTASTWSHDDSLFVKGLFLAGLNYMEIKENH